MLNMLSIENQDITVLYYIISNHSEANNDGPDPVLILIWALAVCICPGHPFTVARLICTFVIP